MVCVIKETGFDVGADAAWAVLRDVGSAERAFPGVLTACRLEDGVRTVTFADGSVIRERILGIDDARRRVAYAVTGGRFIHHSASMQVIPDGAHRCRFVWVSDFLPDADAELVQGLVDRGTEALRRVVGAVAPVNAAGLAGGCSCGAVRYRLGSAPMFVHCCHCRDCQRQTGSAFVINALIETDRIELTRGAPRAASLPTDSGRPHDVYRCPDCLVALWSDYGGRPGLRFVRVGSLDDAAALRPDVHIFTRSKQPWVMLPSGVPAFEAYYKAAAVWPADSLARRHAVLG